MQILRIAPSERSAQMDMMLRQGRAMSAHERNCSFLNTFSSESADRKFATVSAVTGLDFDTDGRATAVVDWDQDGKLDIIMTNRNAPRVRLMLNQSRSDNDFVQIGLIGNGTTTNRDAIGARVILEIEETDGGLANPVKLIRTLRAGDGFMSQSSKWLHFGLGKGQSITSVSVRWPNRDHEVETFENVARNGRFLLEQGTGIARRASSAERSVQLQASPITAQPVELSSRIPLLHPLLAPTLGYYDFDGKPHDFQLDGKSYTLLNFWSVTCAPCLQELGEFTERYNELVAANIRVLAVSIDEIQSGPTSREPARLLANRLGLPFTCGLAPASLVDELTRRHQAIFVMDRPFTMPSSFLIDPDGRLVAVYRGITDVDTIRNDRQLSPSTFEERFIRCSAGSGTYLSDDIVNRSTQDYHAALLLKLSNNYLSENRLDEALTTLEEAIAIIPDNIAVLNEMANIKSVQGDLESAYALLNRALTIEPENADLNVGFAQLLIREAKYADATQKLDVALRSEPDHANAHYNRGLVQESTGQNDDAHASYQRVLEIRPLHPQALFRLGRHYERAREMQQAKRFYQRAVEVAPEEPSVLTALARILMVDNDLANAERLLQSALHSNPRYVEARYQLGMLSLAKGDLVDAGQQFRAVLQINPNHAGAISALRDLQNRN